MDNQSGAKKTFIKPEEFLKIQIRKQQLQQRLKQKSKTLVEKQENTLENSSNVYQRKKRANPFARETEQDQKKNRDDGNGIFSVEDTIFELIHNTKSKSTPNLEAPILEVLHEYEKNVIGIVKENTAKEEVPKPEVFKNLPVDWSIKRCIRILSKSMVVPSTLKSSVEASGLTGFVRCLDIKNTSSGLDISSSARFHQNLMYWQSPHLPWLNLIQRNSSNNNPFKLDGNEVDALYKDWMNSFKNLFNLLRARQCPYFYVLANQYNILFRAAGIGGRTEMHALLTPTTKGFRQMLNDEEIEFSQPLKKSGKSSITPNSSIEQTEDHEEEVDEIAFLEDLGINKSDIKLKENIQEKQREFEDDNGDVSTAIIEGADCQTFFNFLLNAKSTIPRVGKLAGIPPTLISPVGFLGGSLRKQSMKTSKLRIDGSDYFSIELIGAILPHTVHTLTTLLSEIKDDYNLTMSNYVNTIAFTKASKELIQDLDSSQTFVDNIFGVENLSDCGIDLDVLKSMCCVKSDAINIMERLQYSRKLGGFTYF